MTNSKNNLPLFIISGILIIYGLIASTGVLLPTMKYLGTHKTMDLQVTMCLIVGAIGLIGGIVNSIREPKRSNIDTFFLPDGLYQFQGEEGDARAFYPTRLPVNQPAAQQ